MKINIQTIVSEGNKHLVIRKAKIDDYTAVSNLEELGFGIHRAARPDYFKSPENSYTKSEFEELLSYPCPISW